MKLGVIGVGNMGAAIIKGCIASGMKPENIFGTGRDPRRTAAFAEETGIQLCEDIGDLVTKCDAVMIAVKPKDVRSVLKQAAQYLTEKKVVISIAAGLSVEDLQRMAEEGCGPRGVKTKIIRVMPNTPAMVGAGMSALCRNEYVTEEEFEFVMKDFFRNRFCRRSRGKFHGCGDRRIRKRPCLRLSVYRSAGRRRSACRASAGESG